MTRLLLARLGVVLFAATVVLISAAAPPETQPQAATLLQSAEEGSQIFGQSCASCHQGGGTGIEGTFPPLAGNPKAADGAYVESVIRNGLTGPIEVLGVSYDSAMPAVALSDPEIASVVAYVATLAEPSSTPTETTVAAAPAEGGDADVGHDLFVGAGGLAAGGPACAACHSAGSVDGLGGPGLGPDLTGAYDRLGGEAGLTGWLAAPPSPVMAPLFVDAALTEAEIADLVAFLDRAGQEPAPGGLDLLSIAGLGGLALLMGGLAVGSRKLRQTYQARLRSKS